MLYELHLKLSYTYAQPVTHARQMIRVMPRTVPGVQRLIAASLDIAPQPDLNDRQEDFFGNLCQLLQFRTDHGELGLTLRARVERRSPVQSLDFALPLARLPAELNGWRDLSARSPLHFLSESPRIPDLAPFRIFAQRALGDGMTVLDAMHAIAAAIGAHMSFDETATDVDTAPLTAFEKRRGVCQDYAHIMIACLRAVGIPAAYVSGFLRTIPPPGKERLPGSDAMHAWVSVWCGGDIGWREYDPTNALDVADDHILVGYGRDYSDVAPIRGVSRTAGGQSGKHTVDLIPLE